MPSYNYGRFLPAAIESVLGQSFEAFELLVIDNGSSDGSYEIALEYAQRDDRVRVLTHAGRENRGVNASLNLGLAEAEGVYFGLLPADDLYLPDCLERCIARIESEPEAGFVYGTSQVLDEAGHPTGAIGGRSPEDMLRFDVTHDLLQALLFHDFVPGAAAIVRRDLLRAIGGFDQSVYFNDWYAAIRLLARASCAFVSGDPIVGYRLHERHRSVENREADRSRRLELFSALWRHSASAGDRLQERRVRALIALQRAVHASRMGQRDEASAAIADAFAVDPALRSDAEYISWWLDPCHGEWSLALPESLRGAFLAALRARSEPVENALAAGSDYTAFALLVVQADALALESRIEVAWTVLAQQLEATGAGPQLRVLGS